MSTMLLHGDAEEALISKNIKKLQKMLMAE